MKNFSFLQRTTIKVPVKLSNRPRKRLSFFLNYCNTRSRDGSRAAATSKMERFVIIVNGFQPLTIITKCSILDVVAALDSPLRSTTKILMPLDVHLLMLGSFYCA